MPDNRDHQKPKTHPYGVPVPRDEFKDDGVTGVIEDPDKRRAARRKRPTHDRLDKLEDTKDEHIAMFAEQRGQLTFLVKHAEDAEAYRRKREEREEQAAEAEKVRVAAAAERAKFRNWVLVVITTLAGAIVTVIEAVR